MQNIELYLYRPILQSKIDSSHDVSDLEKYMSEERVERLSIPVLPLRDVVVYPHMVIPLFVRFHFKGLKRLALVGERPAKEFNAIQT